MVACCHVFFCFLSLLFCLSTCSTTTGLPRSDMKHLHQISGLFLLEQLQSMMEESWSKLYCGQFRKHENGFCIVKMDEQSQEEEQVSKVSWAAQADETYVLYRLSWSSSVIYSNNETQRLIRWCGQCSNKLNPVGAAMNLKSRNTGNKVKDTNKKNQGLSHTGNRNYSGPGSSTYCNEKTHGNRYIQKTLVTVIEACTWVKKHNAFSTQQKCSSEQSGWCWWRCNPYTTAAHVHVKSVIVYWNCIRPQIDITWRVKTCYSVFLTSKGAKKSPHSNLMMVLCVMFISCFCVCVFAWVQFKFSSAATASHWHRYYVGLF